MGRTAGRTGRNRVPVVVLAVAGLVAGLLVPGVAGAGAAVVAGRPSPVVAESPTGSYVVVMAPDPIAASKDARLGAAADDRAAALVAGQDAARRSAGVPRQAVTNVYTHALNGFSAVMSHDAAVALAARRDVALVLPDEIRRLTAAAPYTGPTSAAADRAASAEVAAAARAAIAEAPAVVAEAAEEAAAAAPVAPGGPDDGPVWWQLSFPNPMWRTGATGEGVVVGVIDTGIWPEHPSFADDGTYPPLDLELEGDACEFGDVAHHPGDAPFECNDKLLGARQMLSTYRALIGAEPDEYDSARDDDGHGTHTAATAAGNADVVARIHGRPLGIVSGVAPRARIIAYKALGNDGGFTSDLTAAIDQAVADGVDVINYSIGGGTSLATPDTIAFLLAARAGVHVATSAGNAGPDVATVGSPGNVPWMTTVAANTQRTFYASDLVLGDGRRFPGASVSPGIGERPLVDAADAGDEFCTPGELDPDVVDGAIVLCLRGVIGRVEKSRAVAQAGGVGMVLYEDDDQGNLFTDMHWVPTVHVDNTPGVAIKAYIAEAERPTARITPSRVAAWPWAPSITDFSSRGPNAAAEDVLKPDVTAPGLQILAAASPTPGPEFVPGELFQAIAGTSMSSPHVAGLLAQIDQVHPEWSPARAKSAIMTTARQDVLDNDRTSPADPLDFGAGLVDPGRVDRAGSPFQPGLVYDADFPDYLGFLCDAAPEVLADPAATCTELATGGVATTTADLNLPSIGVGAVAGERTVTRTVTSVLPGTRDFEASVEAPEGYDVIVTPSRFRLAQGEQMTFRVTIRATSAPVDEWRFGSLTWRSGDGRYDVRSPISVRASAFEAPAEVTAEGESGSTSFQVQFGYDGSYEPSSHGLVPATRTEATVDQDPDQEFHPEDGFATAHTFDLDDVLHLRAALPPEATEPDADLDVFVVDPEGEVVATSTSPGTDELVDIERPADGTWTVWVHGWQAPGGSVDYTLSTWALSGAPGGTLEVTEAPAEAVLGEVATVTVSWTGATQGEWHLGAVGHRRGGELLGTTLVEVDNR